MDDNISFARESPQQTLPASEQDHGERSSVLLGQGLESIFAFDLATGDRTEVSDGHALTGPALTAYADQLAPSGVDDVVLVQENELGALLLLDTVTGHRLLVSK